MKKNKSNYNTSNSNPGILSHFLSLARAAVSNEEPVQNFQTAVPNIQPCQSLSMPNILYIQLAPFYQNDQITKNG